jgi:hypothetical protein
MSLTSAWQQRHVSKMTLAWGAQIQGRRHECPICHVVLLTGEKAGFCCGLKGSHYHDVNDLPPLPQEYMAIIAH